ncbi:MAG: MerR family transcriptional regulator [Acidobacteria bacterium]|nr:MerR family transcriptional regulator [Acidobacteriota bacterium]
MTPMSTAQVASAIGVHPATLEEWLSKRKVKPPKVVKIGARSYRLWTERDVETLKQHKAKFYRKGRGRKKKTS